MAMLACVRQRQRVSTVRNRTMKVGKRLEKSAEALAASSIHKPCEEALVGLDSEYVSARHRRPERNFEMGLVAAMANGQPE
jgi:hypothetical protein